MEEGLWRGSVGLRASGLLLRSVGLLVLLDLRGERRPPRIPPLPGAASRAPPDPRRARCGTGAARQGVGSAVRRCGWGAVSCGRVLGMTEAGLAQFHALSGLTASHMERDGWRHGELSEGTPLPRRTPSRSECAQARQRRRTTRRTPPRRLWSSPEPAGAYRVATRQAAPWRTYSATGAQPGTGPAPGVWGRSRSGPQQRMGPGRTQFSPEVNEGERAKTSQIKPTT